MLDNTPQEHQPLVQPTGNTGTSLRIWSSSAAVRLAVIPHAGAGTASIAHLAAAMTTDVEIVALRMPGREVRVTEAAFSTVRECAHHAADVLSAVSHDAKSLFLLGDCSGALIAYETARELLRRGVPVAGLIVVSQVAPHLIAFDESAMIAQLPSDEFWRALVASGGTDAVIMGSPELMEVLEPSLRADFAAIETYSEPLPAGPLPIAIFAVLGEYDPEVVTRDAAAWSAYTSTTFTLAVIDGDHWLVKHQSQHLAQQVTQWIGKTMSK